MLILKLIKFYKNFISPLSVQVFGSSFGCRFYPTCSEYSYQAILESGVIRGGAKSVFRILRCNPLSKGGVDFVK